MAENGWSDLASRKNLLGVHQESLGGGRARKGGPSSRSSKCEDPEVGTSLGRLHVQNEKYGSMSERLGKDGGGGLGQTKSDLVRQGLD